MPFNRLYILQLAKSLQDIAQQHYEPGRQDKNYHAVWKYHVWPQYRINYRTFLRYLRINVDAEMERLNEENLHV
jgi:hypothetical protein